MEVVQSYHDKHIELKVIGELDASSALDMDNVIAEAIAKGYNTVLLNCEALEYISSAGLGVFVSHLETVRSNNGSFVFYNMRESVKHVFTTLGLDQLITIKDDWEGAIANVEK